MQITTDLELLSLATVSNVNSIFFNWTYLQFFISVEEKRPKTKFEYSYGVLDIRPVRIGDIKKVDHRVKTNKPSKFRGSSKMIVFSKRVK